MSVKFCENCGCRVFGGHCINCHEEIFIAEQYHDLGEPVPENIRKKCAEQEANPSKTC